MEILRLEPSPQPHEKMGPAHLLPLDQIFALWSLVASDGCALLMMCVVGQSTVRVAMTLRPPMMTRTAAARRRGEAGASVRTFSPNIAEIKFSLNIAEEKILSQCRRDKTCMLPRPSRYII